jgi:hypothetical protein
MPNKALVLVAAAGLEVRDQPSTYSSRRPGRHVPAMVDQVVPFTIATEDVDGDRAATAGLVAQVRRGAGREEQDMIAGARATRPVRALG